MKEKSQNKHLSKAVLGLGIALISSSPEAKADQPMVYGEHCKITEYTPKDKFMTDIYYFPGINGRGEMLKAESRKVGERIKNHTMAGFGTIFNWTRSSEQVTRLRMDPKYALPGGLRNYVRTIKSTPGQEIDCKITKIDRNKFLPPAPNFNKIQKRDA